MIHASITQMQISKHVTFHLDDVINQKTAFEYSTSLSILLKISRIVRNVVVISNTFVFHIKIIKKTHFFIVQFSNKLKTQKSNMIANAQSIMSAYCMSWFQRRLPGLDPCQACSRASPTRSLIGIRPPVQLDFFLIVNILVNTQY